MPDFSIADILARGSAERNKYLSQPMGGAAAALPVFGQMATTGAGQYEEFQKKKSVMQAQQDYAQFLSLPPEDKAKPENATKGYQAALSLGINPQSIAIPKATAATKPAKTLEQISAESEARAKGTAKGSGQTLGEDAQSKFAKEIAAGADPSVFSRTLGRAAYRSMPKIIEEAYKINPNLKLQTNTLDYQTKQALMKTDMGSAIQLPARKIAAIIPRLDAADQASKAIPRSQIQIINKLGIAGAAKIGNRQAQDLMNKAKLVADEFQSTIGAGSDSKLDLAMDLLNTSQTVDQFSDAIKNMREAMMARREAILTGRVQETAAPSIPATTGTVTIRDSQGGMHTLPSGQLDAAKKRDPGLTVVNQ